MAFGERLQALRRREKMTQGEFAGLQEARDAIRASFAVKEVLPC